MSVLVYVIYAYSVGGNSLMLCNSYKIYNVFMHNNIIIMHVM